MGAVLVLQGRNDEALPGLKRACALRPNDADVRNNLGSLLALRGQLVEAMASFRRALELQPGCADIHNNLILLLQYQAGDNEAVLAAERQQWHRQHALPLAGQIPSQANERSPDHRLRLGYVSADFRDHVVGHNLLPLFAQHRHDQFEIFCYAQVPQPAALTEKFRALADHWHDIAPLNEAQLAAQVRIDAIDVLVDLALHSAKNRLLAFARQPAPVQVSFAGYPADTGLETMTAHLTDPFLEPPFPGDEVGPDAPFRLPDTFWCYAPQVVDLTVNPLPALTNGFVTFGCLNNFCKVTDATLRHWTQMLLAVPQSRLLLLIPEGRPRQHIIEALTHATIEPERIEFVDRQPRDKYFALYHRIDLGLDTFPHHGHTSSLDSF
ncbi:MAG: tetratricopeptide repeat protein [Opitutus sp.]|nr:tetratricopeptide repeat protein [Opitutus sp.]